MKKASQTNWLANINPNSQTAVCQVRLIGLFIFTLKIGSSPYKDRLHRKKEANLLPFYN